VLIGQMNPTISSPMLAGRLAQFITNWEKITQDLWVLQAIGGYQLELVQPPWQIRPMPAISCSLEEEEMIPSEVRELLSKGAVIEFLLKGEWCWVASPSSRIAACTMGVASLMVKFSSSVLSRRAASGTMASIYIFCAQKATLSSLRAAEGRVAATTGDKEGQVVHLEPGSPYLMIWFLLSLYCRRESKVASRNASPSADSVY